MEEQRCCDDLLLDLAKGGGELIQKILVRLPIKSLGRSKMVSKSWYALIESPLFIDLHITFNNNNNNNSSSKYILLAAHKTSPPSSSVIMMESESADFKLDGLGFPEFGDFSQSVVELGLPSVFKSCEFSKTIVGSCNGLVCIHDDILNRTSLWNPATRQFKILPRPIKVVKDDDLPKRLVAFGFDVETKDYKVMQLTSGFRLGSYFKSQPVPITFTCQVQVYSLSTDSWRLLEEITCLPGFPFVSYPTEVVCLNGSCFFLASFFHCLQKPCIPENDRFIISFDFAKEIFTMMDLPYHHQSQKLHLSCLGNKMALLTVCCIPPPLGEDSYYPQVYEVPSPLVDGHEIYAPPSGIYCSMMLEDYTIWVLDEQVTTSTSSSSSSENKESWSELHSFQIKHQRPGELTSPSCISNDGEFVLLEIRNSSPLGNKMKLFNLGTKEVKKDFLYCHKVLSKAYAYKPSLVKLMMGSSQQQQQPIG